MRPNLEFTADLVTFTGEILNGKPNFVCSVLGECARTIRQEIYKSLVKFWLSKIHSEFKDLYVHCKVKPSSDDAAKTLPNRTLKNAFLESVIVL